MGSTGSTGPVCRSPADGSGRHLGSLAATWGTTKWHCGFNRLKSAAFKWFGATARAKRMAHRFSVAEAKAAGSKGGKTTKERKAKGE